MLRPVLLAAVSLLLPAASLAAQLPGGEIQNPSRMRVEYLSEVYRNVSMALAEWRNAWENDDARAVAEHFVEDGTFLAADGEESRGRAAIRESFACRLPALSGIELKMVDFTAGGDLAYQSGSFTYQAGPPGEPPATRSGRYVVVLQQKGKTWKIRSLQQYADPSLPPAGSRECRAPAAGGNGAG